MWIHNRPAGGCRSMLPIPHEVRLPYSRASCSRRHSCKEALQIISRQAAKARSACMQRLCVALHKLCAKHHAAHELGGPEEGAKGRETCDMRFGVWRTEGDTQTPTPVGCAVRLTLIPAEHRSFEAVP